MAWLDIRGLPCTNNVALPNWLRGFFGPLWGWFQYVMLKYSQRHSGTTLISFTTTEASCSFLLSKSFRYLAWLPAEVTKRANNCQYELHWIHLPRWVSIEVGDNIASYCKLVLTDKTLMFQPSPFGSNQLLHWNGAGYKTTNYWCCMRLSSDASTATVDVAQWAKK